MIPHSEPTWYWDKYHDLPLLRLPSYQFPIYDGDTALLDQLIDDIIAAHPVELAPLPPDSIYELTKLITGLDPDRPWPDTTVRKWWHGH